MSEEKYVHIWEIKCKSCGAVFQHMFRARDLLRPHIFNNLLFTCPKCHNQDFDPVRSIGKIPLEKWKEENPDMDSDRLPEYT
ncbi:hypothetical protein [Caldiplasma sukawensis]